MSTTSTKEFIHNKYVTFVSFLLMVCLVALSLTPWLFFTEQVQADHWLNPQYQQYQYRKKITLNAGMITGTLTNFPVLISFSDTDLNPANGYVKNSNGYDIAFATATHTPIPLVYERTAYIPGTGTGPGTITAWVLIPSLSPTTNEIYIYYGNTNITSSQSNPTAVWGWNPVTSTGANYQGVWHLDETTACPTSITDSSGNGFNGTCVNAPTPVAGQINGARGFSGSSQGINIPSMTIGNTPTNTFTYETWISVNSGAGYHAIMGNYNAPPHRWLGVNGTSNIYHWYDGGVAINTGPAITAGLHHIAVTYDGNGTSIRFYRDGALISTTVRSLTALSTMLFGLGYSRATSNEYFNGTIDEVRVSTSARTAAWIQTSYNNQVNPAGFITVATTREPNTGSAPGVVRSPEIDFDWVPGQGSWAQAIWSTTEPPDGDVRLRVYYTVSTPCDTLVPDAALPVSGNTTTGFDVSVSPLNLSGLNTLTYNRICLEATLTAGAAASPTLNDWKVTWQPPGVGGDRVQSGYRWYENADGLAPGSSLAVQNTPGTLPLNGQAFRLRLLMHVNNQPLLTASTENYRLQFAPKVGPTCDLNMALTDEAYSNVTDSTAIAFVDNPNPVAVNAAPLAPPAGSDPQHGSDTIISQTYQESPPVAFTNSQGDISQGQDGLWDFSLRDFSAPSSSRYCFRMARASGAALDGYAVVPEIVAGAAYALNGTYVSSAFPAPLSRAWNVLEWRQTDVSASCPLCRIRMQIQTSTDGNVWTGGANWCGPGDTSTSCTGASYYTIPTGELIPAFHNSDHYIRYRASLEGDGSHTPVLEEVRINYQQ